MLDIQQELEKYKILNPAYDQQQSEEIELGLKAGVDVSWYTTLNLENQPIFNAGQMREIRKGLIAGVNVSQYTILNSEGKPVFDNEQMEEIRKKLEEELKTKKRYIRFLKKTKKCLSKFKM